MLPFKILFAFLYDLLLLCSVWFVAAIPFVVWQGENLQNSSSSMLGFQVYLLAITYVYLTYFWTQSGQTPGLRTWKLRLITQNDTLLTRTEANLRFLTGILLWPIGWIGLFLPSSRQTLQDRIAKTQITSASETNS
ncbi:RDD family protein [Hydrogenovibrio sp. JE_KL2]|uniref:RDD family protein n=1 Tax=Hydrogenovibrio sp. JE_KL2 TaxID=2651188 RepID=UPI00128B942B|nr:RDD family protein [Hydrogenovibrio sp. JE_KL2]MPQ76859.1 RDD family protein [Hydrogenovibrio sp. JE_KL2]